MVNNKFVLALLASTFVAAQEIKSDDIPQDCRTICEPVLEISRSCNVENDQRERDCICEAVNGPAFAICNECTLRFPEYFIDNDKDDNEVNIWNTRCAFSGNSSSTSSGAMTAAPTSFPSMSMSNGIFTTTVCDDDTFEDPNDGHLSISSHMQHTVISVDGVCVTRVVTGVVPVAAPAPTTNASGNTVIPSSTSGGPAGLQPTQTTQTTQTTGAGGQGAQTSASSFTNSGAMVTAIPMLGAVLAALAAI